jgi:hypothetical protein
LQEAIDQLLMGRLSFFDGNDATSASGQNGEALNVSKSNPLRPAEQTL